MTKRVKATAAAVTYTGVEYGAGAAINGPALGTWIIRHSPATGTRVEGPRKGDGSEDVLGSSGQRWSYTGVGKYWHIGKSAGFSADVERIAAATLAARMGGYDVHVIIDNIDAGTGAAAPAKVRTKASIDRIAECGRAANAQTRVTVPVVEVPAPVVEVPVPAPVAEAPVATAAPRSPRKYKIDTATGSKWVSAPFAGVGMADLLVLISNGVPGAMEAAQSLAGAPAAPAAPGRKTDSGTRAIRQAARNVAGAPASAPATVTVLPTEFRSEPSIIDVPVTALPSTADVAYAGVKARASELRVRLNRSVAHVFGSKGDRPEVHVFVDHRLKGALNVRIHVPANVDREALISAVRTSVAKVSGLAITADVPLATVAPKAIRKVAPVAPVATPELVAQILAALTAQGVKIGA